MRACVQMTLLLLLSLCVSDTAAFTAYTDAVMSPSAKLTNNIAATTTTTTTVAENDGNDGNNMDVTSAPNYVIVAPNSEARSAAADNHVTWTPSTACR